jgi:hypothetical protein
VLVFKSGSKEMSKGRMNGCDAQMFSRSVWRGVVGDMYPASDNAGWRASAQLSRMKWCGSILLCFLQVKIWSPHLSCSFPHGQVGMFALLNIGSRSLRLIAMRKLQFGRRWAGLLRHIEISGYDVCGTRRLGRMCRWSLKQ